MELGSISELMKEGENKGLLAISQGSITYVSLRKPYAPDPEERVRAALYVWLVEKGYQDIKIEEGGIDIQALEPLGSLKIFECEATVATKEHGIGELRSRLIGANLKQGFLIYSDGDKLVSETIDITAAPEILKPEDKNLL